MTYTLASVNYKVKALACVLVHKHGSFWNLKLLQLFYMSTGAEQWPIHLAQDCLRGGSITMTQLTIAVTLTINSDKVVLPVLSFILLVLPRY